MDKEKKRVIEKLMDQCRQAIQARKPLILVDTEELELMERLAQQIAGEKLVDLYEAKKKRIDERTVRYYRYIGYQPDALDLSANFSYNSRILETLAEVGWKMSPEIKVSEKEKEAVLPHLVVLHLTKNPDDANLNDRLRKYVNSYVRRHGGVLDNSSAIRSSCVLIYGDPGLLPKDLLPYTEVLEVEYPREWEIQEILIREARENGQELGRKIAEKLAKQMVGFSVIRVEEYVHRLLWLDGVDGKPLLFCPEEREEIILDAKAQAIRSTGGLLTLYRDKKKKADEAVPQGDQNWQYRAAAPQQEQKKRKQDALGGMGTYKAWAEDAKNHMLSASDFAMERGIPAMKGVLLCGVPGCGKSEAAKVLHRDWGLPMLRMDMDQLMGGLVGDSERNLRQALALAEAMAPCILWLDEIDKGFSGATSGSGDGGTFKRMFGRLLTWMQENKKPCFIFATANDLSQLPPEFFRSGRFDALFSVFMPTNDECREIFEAQMHRAEKLREDTAEEKGLPRPAPLFDKSCYDRQFLQRIMDVVVTVPKGETVKFLSGADIEKIVQTALKSGGLRAPIGTDQWLNALTKVIRDPTLTTQGSGYANMDEIAACYVRLLRKNFVAVSGQDQILFRKTHYRCVSDGEKLKVTYEGTCPTGKAYDRALFEALKGRIEKIATGVEAMALRRLY